MTTRNILIRALLGTMALTAMAPVQAQAMTKVVNADGDTAYQMKVSYADLNLSSPAGQTELKRRVGRATRMVCANHASEQLRACLNFAQKSAAVEIASIIDRNNGSQLALATVR